MEKELNFKDFEGKTKAQWMEKVIADLKGKPFDSLRFTTDDGISIDPFYTKDDLPNQEFIFSPNSWHIRQDFFDTDLSLMNKKILKALNGGVNAIGIFSVFNGDTPLILKDVLVDYILVHVSGNFHSIKINNLADLYQNPKDGRGTLDFTPLFDSYKQVTNFQGEYQESVLDTLDTTIQRLPKFKSILVDVSSVLNNGGTTKQEIGIALAQGNEYIDVLLKNGYDLVTIANQIHFKFAVGSSYFIEIAKLRAFRWTWNQLLESYLPEGKKENFPPTYIHAETSTWNKSVHDVHNNMLRSTTEAMAGILGGANFISVVPFDSLFNDSNDFSLRMARNTLNIIKDEAYLNAVKDVAGGSYYIETITNKYAQAGWKYFQKIEEKGGAIEAIKKRWIEDEIRLEEEKKKEQFAQGEKVLLGVNIHPNKQEEVREIRNNINRLEKKNA